MTIGYKKLEFDVIFINKESLFAPNRIILYSIQDKPNAFNVNVRAT